MSLVKGLLGSGDLELFTIETECSFKDLLEIVGQEVCSLHQRGKTEFGLRCEPFKLNGHWAAAIGPDLKNGGR
jgi:hypothetical protein